MGYADKFTFSSTSAPDKLFDEIDRLCRNLNHKLQKHSTTGAFFGQGKLLGFLCSADGVSQRDLSRGLELSPPTVAETLDKLEAAGLVVRRKDESDCRKILIYITASGRQAALKMQEERNVFLAVLFSSLSCEESAELMRLVTKLNISFDSPIAAQQLPKEPAVKANVPGKIRRGIRLG